MSTERHPLGRSCRRVLPLALLLMPYAVVRHAIDQCRVRRAPEVQTARHPFFDCCEHGVGFLDECPECPDGCPVIPDSADGSGG